MKKHFDDFMGACIGGVSGFIANGFYKDWVQPVIVSAICALIGLIVTHYGKKLLNKWKM